MQGTDRPDRANPRAPQLEPAVVGPPPKDLNPHERRAWRTLAELVDPLRIATRADQVAFRQMAVTLGVIEQAREALNAAGELTYEAVTESGIAFRKRPEVEIIATFKKLLSAELARFGLTPAEREKVAAIGDTAGTDPLDEFSTGGTGAA